MVPFLFILPRMPLRLRNSFRELLYKNTIESLLNQKSKNWKALILGHKSDPTEPSDHFIYLEADDLPKTEKLRIALDYIARHPELVPEYIIRLDVDDIIDPDYLKVIESLPERYDLYYDEYHVCIDPVYLKISFRKNAWVANTAIHKYTHATKRCGPHNEVLFLQDHDSFWHTYYSDKKTFKSPRLTPLYYRILTPYSITSSGLDKTRVDWEKYLAYLNSYGPWISLNKKLFAFEGTKKLHAEFERDRPERPLTYWLFNSLKHYKDKFFGHKTHKADGSDKFSQINPSIAYQECSRCLLTTKDTAIISFDPAGLCSYCNYYDTVTSQLGSKEEKSKYIQEKVLEIRANGKGKEYDCIIGVSGGVDSSYLAYWACENKLRPLIVHFDNGWNSELAVKNIESICTKLGYALQTYVIDWEEFKQLQLAFLRAGVIDIEMLTDHAIIATIYRIAKKYNIKYTLNGFNYATEAVMPKGWVFDKTDFTNIKDINGKFGKLKLRTFPHQTFFERFMYSMFFQIESIRVLNYIDYNKKEAKELLQNKLAWRDYGGKHYESVFTKFYQAYILPVKFGVDKRRAHLSNLICSGEITREQANEVLKEPLYDSNTLQSEKTYILKKLGMGEEEFDKLMKEKPRSHKEFKTQERLWNSYFKLIKILRPWKKHKY